MTSPAFYCTCLLISLCHFFGNCHKFYIHLCGQREQNMKNSYSFLQRHSYIRTKCSSIFTWATWTNYSSPLPRRQTYCLSRIASSYDSSSYTHTIMFGCYLLIFWYRLIISAMKVCYYQTVGEVASLPSCAHWSQCQIDFWGHFRVGNVTFFIFFFSFDIDLSYLRWWCATNIKELLRCNSEEEYTEEKTVLRNKWSNPIVSYFQKLERDILKHCGKWGIDICMIRFLVWLITRVKVWMQLLSVLTNSRNYQLTVLCWVCFIYRITT